MSDITTVIQTFLTELDSLPEQGRHDAVGMILQPALDAERGLRILFAQHPELPYLDDLYLGLIDVFTLTANMRRARPRPRNGLYIGRRFQSGQIYYFPQHYLLPLSSSMRRPQGSSVFVETMEQFQSHWNIFTHNALSKLEDWTNIVVAGGSILACLSSPLLPALSDTNVELNNLFQSNVYADSDIDIFIWGLTPEERRWRVYLLQSEPQYPGTSFASGKQTQSQFTSAKANYPARPIQIILRLYRSPAEILAGFDVDAACCLYNGNRVYITPRALVANICQANTIDITRRSPSYEVRLAKYADRGFEVYFPGLDRTRLDYLQLYDRYLKEYPKGLARLVVLELIREHPFHYQKIYRPSLSSENLSGRTEIDFKPVQKYLSKNNYDSVWVRIPYGPNWDAERVKKLVASIDSRANSRYNPSTGAQRLHRHAAFCGTMAECLSEFCPACPRARNEQERKMIAAEALKYIRGPVQFIQSNPGRQMITGSFNPIDVRDWSSEAYSNVGWQDDVGYIYIQDTWTFVGR